jgi:integrase/recombinase XerD
MPQAIGIPPTEAIANCPVSGWTDYLRTTPHVFRHTAAVHLLEAGVEVHVIRGWLAHVSLETTNRYAEITARMKEAAMKLCGPATVGRDRWKAEWQDDAALLTWLASL